MSKDAITPAIVDLNEKHRKVLEIKVDLNRSKCLTVDDEEGFAYLYLSKETAVALADYILYSFKKEEE